MQEQKHFLSSLNKCWQLHETLAQHLADNFIPPSISPSLLLDPNALGQHGPDHALIGGVVAVVVFITLCLIIVLGRYLARHKGKRDHFHSFYLNRKRSALFSCWIPDLVLCLCRNVSNTWGQRIRRCSRCWHGYHQCWGQPCACRGKERVLHLDLLPFLLCFSIQQKTCNFKLPQHQYMILFS